MSLCDEKVLGETGFNVWKRMLSLNCFPLNTAISDYTVIQYFKYRNIHQSQDEFIETYRSSNLRFDKQ